MLAISSKTSNWTAGFSRHRTLVLEGSLEVTSSDILFQKQGYGPLGKGLAAVCPVR